ncbi:DNA-directed RNA polymerase [Candidatus Micrarchaeota archaeon]|nr:DNA-directed RNA polymerase [Candidatus Micrarchaeota archaeon]HIH20044.1 DNA-directed RNA polymerase [Candidatus Micrarchaeota archaeon]HLD62644.1 CxxC-x17-CxxC domain-containing protein [Candidatus Norongarragalinales archaeon]
MDGDSGQGGFRGGYGDRKMYKAVCSDCGQECEVPFEPAPGKPVYCRDCYQKHRKPRRY